MSASSVRPSRRAFLGGALALPLASACTDSEQPAASAPSDPDAGFRGAAAAREHALLRAYDAALAARPDLAARLQPLRQEHVEHLAALGVAAGAPSLEPTRTVPSLAALAAAEAAAGAGHARDAVVASRALAPVLASLAASEASHRVSLR